MIHLDCQMFIEHYVILFHDT